jgi:hypothetical protein
LFPPSPGPLLWCLPVAVSIKSKPPTKWYRPGAVDLGGPVFVPAAAARLLFVAQHLHPDSFLPAPAPTHGCLPVLLARTRSFNHPSVIFHGFFNEGDSSNSLACPAYATLADVIRTRTKVGGSFAKHARTRPFVQAPGGYLTSHFLSPSRSLPIGHSHSLIPARCQSKRGFVCRLWAASLQREWERWGERGGTCQSVCVYVCVWGGGEWSSR